MRLPVCLECQHFTSQLSHMHLLVYLVVEKSISIRLSRMHKQTKNLFAIWPSQLERTKTEPVSLWLLILFQHRAS